MQQRHFWSSINWTNSAFLGGCFLTFIVGAPLYIWQWGLDPFQLVLFSIFFIVTGLSITLGYHRLFSHRAFEGSWPVRMLTLLFGAAAFENSALAWANDHRRHHKFADHEEDPYNIQKGFLYAHIGWVLVKSEKGFEFVRDLQRDPLVAWQHRWYVPIAVAVSFGLPALAGGLWGGWTGALGGFLIAGVARVVLVQQFTFFINSLCHTLGRQPYSKRCTARDSAVMALFTFGEGYHNFHHAFQHDYRNGVRPWQFDPTKWTIWVLWKLGLARNLRRVPQARILFAEAEEQQRSLSRHIGHDPSFLPEPVLARWRVTQQKLEDALRSLEQLETEYRKAAREKYDASRERIIMLHAEWQTASARFRAALREWRETHQLVRAELQIA